MERNGKVREGILEYINLRERGWEPGEGGFIGDISFSVLEC